MNIAKALKVRARLVGLVNSLQDFINYNQVVTSVYQIGNSTQNEKFENQKELVAVKMSELDSTREKLVKCKIAISKASFGIADKLVELAELKSELIFFSNLRVIDSTNLQGVNANIVHQQQSVFTQAEFDAKVNYLKTRIEETQDFIDDYNASTKVEEF
jgi:hypothetical protein